MGPVVEKMQADGAAEFVAFAVAAAGDAALALALDPAEILVENEVDYTGHRVRTVGRRGAASDPGHTLDHLLRMHEIGRATSGARACQSVLNLVVAVS